MSKATEHLANILAEDLEDFKYELFVVWQTYQNKKGIIQIGCSSFNEYLVKCKHETWHFKYANEAVEKYKELVNF